MDPSFKDKDGNEESPARWRGSCFWKVEAKGIATADFLEKESAADGWKEEKEESMGINDVFVEIGHGVEVAVKDVVKGAEDVLSVGGKVIKVIADVKAVSPEFKANLATLVDDAKAIAVPLAPVVASGGENVAADLVALTPVVKDVMKLVKDFITFLPSVEAALKTVYADVQGA